ncbi:hypothetical protein LEN26_000455 [Aphanomyces euteiches]|nr:hypothetical protein AeMF1_019106 [Aphanomyces euteiches]KAH9163539.1 hypothetical protein LEN26_000455 [Aphanomyces euteiches]KAH9194829.1 hypothetical protein AeNC1_003193 [Aphanomyces euteiches]
MLATEDSHDSLDLGYDTTALGLPAVPPSSDPQRLLNYVLQILPRYTSMELSTTHFRLYNQHLVSEMEQLKASLALAQERVRDEQEKRFFLEKYASEVVKERNELLHHKGKKSAHKLWHNCCRKHASYDLDVTPSIASLRGEKLTQVGVELKQAQDALQEKDRLLRAAQHVVQTKQIEFDVHLTSCRRERDQLHNYIAQISGLQSSQERHLYDAQSQLARQIELTEQYDREIDQLLARIDELEHQLAEQSSQLSTKQSRIDELTAALKKAAQVEQELQARCQQLMQPGREVEIEALKSQVEALETTGIQQLTRKYAKHIQQLQDTIEKNERTIDQLQHEVHRTQPMTINEISRQEEEKHKAALSSSWNDSLDWSYHSASLAQTRREDGDEAEELEDEEDESEAVPSLVESQVSMSSQEVKSSKGNDKEERDAILAQLKFLLDESATRRKNEEAQAKLDLDYLVKLRQRVEEHPFLPTLSFES